MKLKLRINKKILWILVSLSAILIFLVFLADLTITRATNDRVFNNTKYIPYHKVGLLLGTSKFLNSGQVNRYFKYRIEAVVDLYKSHKIDYIVISGDNSQKITMSLRT